MLLKFPETVFAIRQGLMRNHSSARIEPIKAVGQGSWDDYSSMTRRCHDHFVLTVTLRDTTSRIFNTVLPLLPKYIFLAELPVFVVIQRLVKLTADECEPY